MSRVGALALPPSALAVSLSLLLPPEAVCRNMAGGVARYQVVVPLGAAAGLFDASSGDSATFLAHSYDEAALGRLELPVSAVEAGGRNEARPEPQALPGDVFLQADGNNGLFHLGTREPAPAEQLARTDAPPGPATARRLGRNVILGETVLTSNGPAETVTGASAEEFKAKKAGPLAYALWRAQGESARLVSKAASFETQLAGAAATFDQPYATGAQVQVRSIGEKSDPSAPPLLREGESPDVDRDSVLPFSRALVRYGLQPAQVRAILSEYHKVHQAATPQAYHNMLLGIRAANLMAQYLAAHEPHSTRSERSETFHVEETTSDPRQKQALILAALLHRTGNPLVKEIPTAGEAASYLHYGEIGGLLRNIRIHQDDMNGWVSALISATDYSKFARPSDRRDALSNLNRALNFGTDAEPARRQHGRLAAILQLVTRASMFTDGPAFAEAAVRARAAEARAAAAAEGRPGPTDEEAFLAAAAEIDQILSGRMPASEREAYLRLPDGAALGNLVATYRHFRGLAATLVNQRTVTARVIPD